MAMISVLMSVYKEPLEYVRKSVESILNQTYTDFELIIIIDNPMYSEMIDYLKKLANENNQVMIHVNEKNCGLASSLNTALSLSSSEYIARMDADDISLPQRFERQLKFLQENNLDIVSCSAEKMDENDESFSMIQFSADNKQVKNLLPIQNIIVHPTILARTEVIKKVDGYRKFPTCQDYDLWLRLLAEGYKFAVMDEVLFRFRVHQNSITTTKHFNQILTEKYIRKLYNKRKKSGYDDFSEEKLQQYVCKFGYNKSNICEKENKAYREYELIKCSKNKGHKIIGGFKILIAMRYITVRTSVLTSVRAKMIKRRKKG